MSWLYLWSIGILCRYLIVNLDHVVLLQMFIIFHAIKDLQGNLVYPKLVIELEKISKGPSISQIQKSDVSRWEEVCFSLFHDSNILIFKSHMLHEVVSCFCNCSTVKVCIYVNRTCYRPGQAKHVEFHVQVSFSLFTGKYIANQVS